MRKIEIPIKKLSATTIIIAAIPFIIEGGNLFLNVAHTQTSMNPIYVKILGITSILFFSSLGIFGIIKLFKTEPGLILDDAGIVDNVNLKKIGVIKWSDIKEIKTKKIFGSQFILIHSTNPEMYLSQHKEHTRRKLERNIRKHGTPLVINASVLVHNFDELVYTIKERAKNDSSI